MENIECPESICIDKLICVLWMRREEAAPREKAAIDRQAHELLDFFKGYPMYQRIAGIMEEAWNDGSIMTIYQ